MFQQLYAVHRVCGKRGMLLKGTLHCVTVVLILLLVFIIMVAYAENVIT
jgi:hypothetical protein